MMRYNFCTLFDKNYLSKGLALLHSIENNVADYRLHVLCLDTVVYNYFTDGKFKNVILITLKELEAEFINLNQVKKNRSLVEYYFTLSPFLPLYILKHFPESKHICSLDADVFFFSSPSVIFDKLKNFSIIITPHKYSDKLKSLNKEKYGLYNVSFQVFKNNEIGLKCLTKWGEDCADWCHDYYDEKHNRFADQKYLDKWESDFPGEVISLDDPSSGLAVWNIDRYKFSMKNGEIIVNDGPPLIFYHFHHFKIINPFFALNGFAEYEVENDSVVLKNGIYYLYWNALKSNSLMLQEDSIRQNFKINLIKLLIIHKTGFLEFFKLFFYVNTSILSVAYEKYKTI